MQTTIQKWGNSLGVRIPKAFADQTRLAAGSTVDISLENGGIVIRPTRRSKYNLADLLAKVTPQNIHAEVDTGPSVGREAW